MIDVLRMTSTASVLMRRAACDRLAVAATLDDLGRLSLPVASFVVVSEVAGAPDRGGAAWLDNSPAQAAHFPFEGRTPVLVTTNGTQALLAAAACGGQVLLASFRDLRAVGRYLAEPGRSGPSVVLVPAGHVASGDARVEDDLCAEALATLLAGGEPDFAAAAAVVRAAPHVLRRIEDAPGFSADLDAALTSDPQASVLEFHATAAGVGEITRARMRI